MQSIQSVIRPWYTLATSIYRRFIGMRTGEFPVEPYRFSKQDAHRVYQIILSGRLHHKMGTEVASLEKEFALYHNVKYALATNSGTSALEMALKIIGIKPGDEVIVPAFTFVATAQAVLNRGGVPVFADIDDTYTLDPASLKRTITQRTKAIIPVHIFGNVADMTAIMTIARTHKLKVVEDACQAVGAEHRGKKVGSIGDVGCFSFDSQKAIFTGQGGMLITNNASHYNIALRTRETGQLHDERGSDVITTGNTYAMTEMQAALARSILEKLDELNLKRRLMYDFFVKTIDVGSLPLRWYRVLPDVLPSYSRIVFMVDFNRIGLSRSQFMASMHDRGIPLRTFYPVPLYKYSLFRRRVDMLTHNQFPFNMNKHVEYDHTFLPFVEQFCNQQIGINWSPYITDNQVRALCVSLNGALKSKQKIF